MRPILCLIFLLALCSETVFAFKKGEPRGNKEPTTEPSIADKATEQRYEKLKFRAQAMLQEGEGKRITSLISGKATQLEAKCPSCDHNFLALHITSPTAERGTDRDFCRHPYYKTDIDLDVWTCTNCGFSHFKNFFNAPLPKPLPDDIKELLEGSLIAGFTKQFGINIKKIGFTIDQQDIPTNIKYSLMSIALPHLDLPWKIQADFHLKFAWSERIRGCAPIRSPHLSTTIGSLNEQLDLYQRRYGIENITSNPTELLLFFKSRQNKDADPLTTFAILLYESAQYNRLGFLYRASELLDKALAMPLPEPVKTVGYFKKRVLQSQLYHLKETVVCMKEAIRMEEHNLGELRHTIYLLGEIQRRIGLFGEAKVWFNTTLECIQKDSPLAQWADEQQRSLPEKLGLPPDNEQVLAQKASDAFREMKKVADASSFNPADISPEKVQRWLGEIQIAATTYHRKYELDPEELVELYRLELLKGQPDLKAEHLRFFSIEVDPESRLSSTRYTIHCLLPLFDNRGSFMLSISMGKIIRTPTQT